MLRRRNLLLLYRRKDPRWQRPSPGRLWRRAPGRGTECEAGGQRGNPGRLLQPPGRAGLCALLQPPPPVAAVAPAPRPAPRAARPASLTHRATLAASCLRFLEPEVGDRRGLSLLGTLSGLSAGPAYLWLPSHPRPPSRDVQWQVGRTGPGIGLRARSPRWEPGEPGAAPHWGGDGLPGSHGTT